MARPRLTKRAARGLWELIPVLDALQDAGWEGTTLECRADDCGGPKKCGACRDRRHAEHALAWLTETARSTEGPETL